MHFGKIARRRAVALRRSRERHQFTDLLDRESKVAAATDEGEPAQIALAVDPVAVAAGPIGHWAEERFGGQDKGGLAGQFGVGVLLGAVWTPCIGPTLGAASALAAQGRDLVQVAVTMLLFAIGTAIPLLLLGLLSREAMLRWRGRMGLSYVVMLIAFYVDNGKQLPLWKDLPHFMYWLIPITVGIPLVVRALLWPPLARPRAGIST